MKTLSNLILSSHQPLVTIGLPVYNGEKFLAKTIESLLAQEYQNFELLISDNASEDSTAAICHEYAAKDPRITYRRNITNIGPMRNGSRLLDEASGEFIMFAADHDLWAPHFISTLLSELQRDDSIVLAYPRTVMIDENDAVTEIASDLLDTRGLDRCQRFSRIMWEFCWGNMVYGLFRTAAYRQIWKPFDVIGPDHVLMASLSLVGTIVQVDEPLFFRRDNRPNEKAHETLNRYIEWFSKSGLERLVPRTLMAYEHVNVIMDSELTELEKEALLEDVKTCFLTRFGGEMQVETLRLAKKGHKIIAELHKYPCSRVACSLEFARLVGICRFFFPGIEELKQFLFFVNNHDTSTHINTINTDVTSVQVNNASVACDPAIDRSASNDVLFAGKTLLNNAETISSAGKPSIVFINTYYDAFLREHYLKNPSLHSKSYADQKESIQSECFGDSDFYSVGLKRLGWQADDLIVNAPLIQAAWAKENGFTGEGLAVALEQIRRCRPDIVYIQDLSVATREFLELIRQHTRLIVGQIASPLPHQTDAAGFDIIFSSFPHFVACFRKAGITAYYQPLAFDPCVLERTPDVSRDIPLSFVGGISPQHGKGLENLEQLAGLVPVQFWGYGAAYLRPDSPIAGRHHGEAWGREMFTLLRRSQITINRHIDVAENYANNMRLFEATGCGALLITDYKDNLNDLFEIGTEVVAYRSPEECAALINYYLANPDEAEVIARAGQARTLREHTYALRMVQTAEVLERHLRYQREQERLPHIDISKISFGHTAISKTEITATMASAWQDNDIPAKQRALVQQELLGMYKGKIATQFRVLADIITSYTTPGCSVLEIGCASGYYYEILEYLLNKHIDYTGVDYSEAMIAMAKDYYPKVKFFTADGADLFFSDRQFHTVISSCILLHVPNYRDHIFETARVADKFIVASRTPICKHRPTQYVKKYAYGVETVELVFNEEELIKEFAVNRFKLVNAIAYNSNPAADAYEITLLFKRV